MKVYRVEHITRGHGPYWQSSLRINRNGSSNRPGPEYKTQAVLYEWERDHRVLFGFESIEQLESWFGKKSRAYLAINGYCIKEYRARKIYKEKKQLIFVPSGKGKVFAHGIQRETTR